MRQYYKVVLGLMMALFGITLLAQQVNMMLYERDVNGVVTGINKYSEIGNGSAVKMESGIRSIDVFPDTALCTLTILRGSVENELVNGYSCKLVAESHQYIQFILIRNVKKNEA